MQINLDTVELDAPFSWFGGKRRAADDVWTAFGDVAGYIEPCCASAAVLLRRPGGAGSFEVINDKDCFIANFWRAVRFNPEDVAREVMACPINEADLHARHYWLINNRDFRERMHRDPDYFDVKVAAWWVWGKCQWIGGGWCTDERQTSTVLPNISGANGVFSKRDVLEWFKQLQYRLRGVRIACGDWQRVVMPSVLGKASPCAVFFDPPFSHVFRSWKQKLYVEDNPDESAKVREWCIEHGNNPNLRIALCGYEGEHEMPDNWTQHVCKNSHGLSSENCDTHTKERIWFSPACLPPTRQTSLF